MGGPFGRNGILIYVSTNHNAKVLKHTLPGIREDTPMKWNKINRTKRFQSASKYYNMFSAWPTVRMRDITATLLRDLEITNILMYSKDTLQKSEGNRTKTINGT